MLKLAGSKEPAPAPVDDAPPADAGFGGDDAQPSSDDKPFDAEPFDAGVEADEQSDPKKFIEQLTGKLGQSLRKYNEEQGQPDFELEKFAINSLLAASHTSEMDAQDQDDIIKKVKTAGNNDDNQDDNQDDNGDNNDSGDDSGDFGGSDDADFGGDLGDSGSEGEDDLQENGGSVIDFEGVADSLMNILTSNQFSDESDDRVYRLAKKTLENRSVEEKIKLYKTIAIKLQNFSNAFPIAANMASQYYSIASRLEGTISNGLTEMEDLFLDEPKRNNMFQPGSNDILDNDLIESKKSSIFVKIKTKLKETFNQEETMSEPMIEPQVKPVVKPAPDKVQPNIAPSRKNKPFLPMPEVTPDPKAIKEGKFDYETYHKTLSNTLDEVRKYVLNRGFDPIEFDINDVQHVAYGHTERFYKELTKNGKPLRNTINVQIYRMDSGNYELNMYIA